MHILPQVADILTLPTPIWVAKVNRPSVAACLHVTQGTALCWHPNWLAMTAKALMTAGRSSTPSWKDAAWNTLMFICCTGSTKRITPLQKNTTNLAFCSSKRKRALPEKQAFPTTIQPTCWTKSLQNIHRWIMYCCR